MTEIIKSEQAVDFVELKRDLATELRPYGGAFCCTVRGSSRLLEISPSSLVDTRRQKNGTPMGLLHKVKECSVEQLPNSLKPICGFDFKAFSDEVQPNTHAVCLLPEIVVSCIIKYYAYDARIKNPRAVMLDNLFSTMGIRAFFKALVEEDDTHSIEYQQATAVTVHQPEEFTVDNTTDNRVAVVKEVLDVLANASPEYKEKALLTLLGVL